jgi:GAF domain-containing protein
VTKQRAPMISADVANDSRTSALGMLAVGSLLSAPLLAGQQVLGALTISSPSISAFRPHHLRLLELVADLAALAMMQTRRLVAVAQPLQPRTRPLEILRGPQTTSGTSALFGLAVSAIQQLVCCEEAVIYCYDVGTETLCGVAGLGIHSTSLAQARISVRDPQSVTAWVAQQGRPLLLSGGATGFIGRATETLLAARELALLAVPIVTPKRLWGVITLVRATPFEVSDLRTMLHVSQMIAPGLVRIGDA